MFKDGLNPEILQWALVSGDPDTLMGWICLAGDAEGHLQEVHCQTQVTVGAFIDSGCSKCLNHPTVAEELGLRFKRLKTLMNFEQMDGSSMARCRSTHKTEPVLMKWSSLGKETIHYSQIGTP
uniref:Uncharacterized protein n=1 Tax=Sphaerodactylus townsendi TaxID=933632 RepID=A0ACB8ESZ7_9SAUR